MYIIFAKNFKVLYILAFFGSLTVFGCQFLRTAKNRQKVMSPKIIERAWAKIGLPPPETFTEIERLLCKSIKICDYKSVFRNLQLIQILLTL